ncbi:MAG: hypothetical protein LBU07_06975 [Coriobacteriales bacterium]|jgi:hypothetical protein|nr:hypothetical protein [Coriobacteriales bacterium]
MAESPLAILVLEVNTAASLSAASAPASTPGIHTIKIEEYGVTAAQDNTYQWFRAFGQGGGGALF